MEWWIFCLGLEVMIIQYIYSEPACEQIEGRCYWVTKTKASFDDINEDCQKNGGILANIENKNISDQLKNVFTQEKHIWIGVRKDRYIGINNLSYTSLNKVISWTNWVDDENRENLHACVRIDRDKDWEWEAEKCSTSTVGLCYKLNSLNVSNCVWVGDKCYWMSKSAATSVGANKECMEKGGVLSTVRQTNKSLLNSEWRDMLALFYDGVWLRRGSGLEELELLNLLSPLNKPFYLLPSENVFNPYASNLCFDYHSKPRGSEFYEYVTNCVGVVPFERHGLCYRTDEICLDGVYDGQCYWLTPGVFDKAVDAERSCSAAGGTMATIPNSETWRFLRSKFENMMSDYDSVWLGYRDESPYYWYTLQGKLTDWSNWKQQYKCAAFDAKHGTFKWKPKDCSSKNSGLCQSARPSAMGNCKTDGVVIHDNCYWLTPGGLEQTEAQAHCQNDGGELAYVSTEQEWYNITHSSLTFTTDDVFIGITTEPRPFRTLHLNEPTWTNWKPSKVTTNDCVVIDKDNFQWESEPFSNQHYALCSNTTGDAAGCNRKYLVNHQCFWLLDTLEDMSKQEAACEEQGGTLATFDKATWDLLKPNLPTGEDMWIGVARVRYWYTMSGISKSNPDELFWNAGEPHDEDKHCAVLNTQNGGLMDELCNTAGNPGYHGACQQKIPQNNSSKSHCDGSQDYIVLTDDTCYWPTVEKFSTPIKAKEKCEKDNGKLCVPNLEIRNLILESQDKISDIPGIDDLWVDLTDKPRFWYSWYGERMTWFNWETSEPGNGDDCVVFKPGSSYKWFSTSCNVDRSNAKPALCMRTNETYSYPYETENILPTTVTVIKSMCSSSGLLKESDSTIDVTSSDFTLWSSTTTSPKSIIEYWISTDSNSWKIPSMADVFPSSSINLFVTEVDLTTPVEASTSLGTTSILFEASAILDIKSISFEASTSVDITSHSVEASTTLDIASNSFKASTSLDITSMPFEASSNLDITSNSFEASSNLDLTPSGFQASSNLDITSGLVEASTSLDLRLSLFEASSLDITSSSFELSTSLDSIASSYDNSTSLDIVSSPIEPSTILDITSSSIEVSTSLNIISSSFEAFNNLDITPSGFQTAPSSSEFEKGLPGSFEVSTGFDLISSTFEASSEFQASSNLNVAPTSSEFEKGSRGSIDVSTSLDIIATSFEDSSNLDITPSPFQASSNLNIAPISTESEESSVGAEAIVNMKNSLVSSDIGSSDVALPSSTAIAVSISSLGVFANVTQPNVQLPTNKAKPTKVNYRLCGCGCGRGHAHFSEPKQLADEIKKITNELKVPTETLSSTIRKRQSAIDSRSSAKQIGTVTLTFITIISVVIVIPDIVKISRTLIYHNILYR